MSDFSDETGNNIDLATQMAMGFAKHEGISPDSDIFVYYLYGILEAGAIYESLKAEVPPKSLAWLSVLMAELRATEYVDSKGRPDLEVLVETQIAQARLIIGEGKNYQAQLNMWKDGKMAIAMLPMVNISPMTAAISLIQALRPEMFTFGSETWMAVASTNNNRGDPEEFNKIKEMASQHRLSELDTKIEGFAVIGMENGGRIVSRFFTIDRVNKTLEQDEDINKASFETRMPRKW